VANTEDFDWEKLDLRLSSVFQPSTPIGDNELFRGRKSQVRLVVDAINQPGRHAILFGGRGVGKTSLGQTLPARLRTIEPTPIISPFIACDSSDDYSSIWFKVFSEIEYQVSINPLLEGFKYETKEEEFEDAAIYEWTPYAVRRQIESLGNQGVLYVVIDEFDKMDSPEDRQLIADTIKLFSDRAVRATIILIGVSDDVMGLIDDHRSIERCLAQIPMPRMPRGELESIVVRGLEKVGMAIKEQALAEISGLSKGLPTYAHLLALHSSRKAVASKMRCIILEHVKLAIKTAISETEETVRTEYDKAIYSPRETLHSSVLLACAMASTDEFGRFQPNSVCEPMHAITGKTFTSDRFSKHLKDFCNPERGSVLRRMGGEYKWRYQFTNPLIQPFVLMKGLDAGKITESQLQLDPDPEHPLFRE